MRRSTASCGISMSCPPDGAFPLDRPGLAWRRVARSITDRSGLHERDEAAFHHAVEDGKETVDLLVGVDDLDHHRLPRSGIDAELRADMARSAEALGPGQHGRPGHSHLAGTLDDGLVKRPLAVTVVRSDENPQKHGFDWHRHGTGPPELGNQELVIRMWGGRKPSASPKHWLSQPPVAMQDARGRGPGPEEEKTRGCNPGDAKLAKRSHEVQMAQARHVADPCGTRPGE